MVLKQEYPQQLALWGFEILGEDARPAIPDLVRMMKMGPTENANMALRALGFLGEDAFPHVLAVVTNRASDTALRMNAVIVTGRMGYLGTNAAPAIPVLIEYLKDPQYNHFAADALGNLLLDSELAVPALMNCLGSSDDWLCLSAVRSLGKFGEKAAPAVPALVRIFSEARAGGNWQDVRREATNAVRRIAPEALEPR
jgi:HEAT repeat protein